MSDIPDALLDALIALPGVQCVWLRPCQRRGSHFGRADHDLLIHAPDANEAEWQRALELVDEHEGWLLISVFRLSDVPPADARRVRPVGL